MAPVASTLRKEGRLLRVNADSVVHEGFVVCNINSDAEAVALFNSIIARVIGEDQGVPLVYHVPVHSVKAFDNVPSATAKQCADKEYGLVTFVEMPRIQSIAEFRRLTSANPRCRETMIKYHPRFLSALGSDTPPDTADHQWVRRFNAMSKSKKYFPGPFCITLHLPVRQDSLPEKEDCCICLELPAAYRWNACRHAEAGCCEPCKKTMLEHAATAARGKILKTLCPNCRTPGKSSA